MDVKSFAKFGAFVVTLGAARGALARAPTCSQVLEALPSQISQLWEKRHGLRLT